ncbi:MAG: hypothetical protein QOI54_2603 [Actinomycetota bacterium]|jgi:uncharacterized protein with FMN-binding domain|nr:hypothetical protein [Actinomycetota bacterium]
MRRIVLAIVSTIAGLILLFGYRTSTMGATVVDQGSTTASSSGQTQAPQSTTSGSGGGAGAGDGTFTGDTVATRWGPVQVRITVSAGRITAATAVTYPDGNGRDQQINAVALPVLAQEVLTSQSARIDHVSGATVTSEGYIASLQSALDQANL